MADFNELREKAIEIRDRYKLLNKSSNHDEWSGKEYAMGLVGDTGDLLKLVMAKENLRHIDDVDKKLQHELADCLWSLLVIAEQYGIDLEQTFKETMEELDDRLSKDNA